MAKGMHKQRDAWQSEYGPIFVWWLGSQPVVVVADPEEARKVPSCRAPAASRCHAPLALRMHECVLPAAIAASMSCHGPVRSNLLKDRYRLYVMTPGGPQDESQEARRLCLPRPAVQHHNASVCGVMMMIPPPPHACPASNSDPPRSQLHGGLEHQQFQPGD